MVTLPWVGGRRYDGRIGCAPFYCRCARLSSHGHVRTVLNTSPSRSEQTHQQVDRIEETAGEPPDHGAVDADILEIVAGVLLDESHGAFRPQRVHALFDERGDAAVVALHQLGRPRLDPRSEEHTSELQSLAYLVCRLLLEKKKQNVISRNITPLTTLPRSSD